MNTPPPSAEVLDVVGTRRKASEGSAYEENVRIQPAVDEVDSFGPTAPAELRPYLTRYCALSTAWCLDGRMVCPRSRFHRYPPRRAGRRDHHLHCGPVRLRRRKRRRRPSRRAGRGI